MKPFQELLAWITLTIESGKAPDMQLYDRSMFVRDPAIL